MEEEAQNMTKKKEKTSPGDVVLAWKTAMKIKKSRFFLFSKPGRDSDIGWAKKEEDIRKAGRLRGLLS